MRVITKEKPPFSLNILDIDLFPGEKLVTDKLWVESRYTPEERADFFTAPLKKSGFPLALGILGLLAGACVLVMLVKEFSL